MIGIVSHLDDLHAVHVRRHLEQAGSAHLVLDTSSLPMQVGLTTSEVPGAGWHGWWEHDGVPVDLRDVHAMWWRRPQPFVLDGAITDAHDRAFARGECAAMVAGLWHCLDAEWVNDPDRDEAASRKMWQAPRRVRGRPAGAAHLHDQRPRARPRLHRVRAGLRGLQVLQRERGDLARDQAGARRAPRACSTGSAWRP